ncbi:MAG: hypothetical protein HS119_14660 [Flavobacteriales bacterium]|nr:hypothetical protein [Flavobacteriales bacterium]MCL4855682.1 hypothetical protein [Flavobacteriales bacterium]
MNRAVLIIFFLCWSNISFSQANDSLKIKKYSITTSILDYVSEFRTFNEITYNIEFSLPIKNRYFVHVNVGYLKSTETNKVFFNAFPNPIDKTQGYRFQLEGRHYLNKHKLFEPSLVLFWLGLFQYKSLVQNNTGYYIAFQSKYQFTETDREETVVDYIQEQPYFQTFYKQNNYTVDRNMLGSYFKFGYNAIKKSGFTVDYAVGIGAVYISSSSENKLGNSNDGDFPYDKSFDDGSRLHFDLAYSFKIGWSF